MRSVRDGVAHVVLGAVGLICGLLSAIALTVAGVISATIGLLAFLFSPLRVLSDRVRGRRVTL